jgi:hypothetical protein
VAYHWGYALYDQDWKELEQIEVNRGTTVQLTLFPTSVLSDEIKEGLWQRTVDEGIAELSDIIEANDDPDKANHGLSISGYKLDLATTMDTSNLELAVDSIEFIADTIGTFNLLCPLECGSGHTSMRLEGALIVN